MVKNFYSLGRWHPLQLVVENFLLKLNTTLYYCRLRCHLSLPCFIVLGSGIMRMRDLSQSLILVEIRAGLCLFDSIDVIPLAYLKP